MTITDEQLEQKEREVAELIGFPASGTPGGMDDSRQRIERILRRIRLENRIQEEADATIERSGAAPETGTDAPAE
jgi:hypothetical protein